MKAYVTVQCLSECTPGPLPLRRAGCRPHTVWPGHNRHRTPGSDWLALHWSQNSVDKSCPPFFECGPPGPAPASPCRAGKGKGADGWRQAAPQRPRRAVPGRSAHFQNRMAAAAAKGGSGPGWRGPALAGASTRPPGPVGPAGTQWDAARVGPSGFAPSKEYNKKCRGECPTPLPGQPRAPPRPREEALKLRAGGHLRDCLAGH